jgi:long-subunit fatty acid transport protein
MNGKRHKRISLLAGLVLLFFASASLQAQLFPNLGGQRVGISAYQFLKIGGGARAEGMGEAFVAVANDASSLYWNPAGMTQFSDNQILFAHTEYVVDMQHEFLASVYHLTPTDAVGFSMANLHTQDIPITTEYQPFGTGSYYTYADLALALSYSRKMTDQFSFGITTRYVTETLGDLKMNGTMIDLGTYYWTGLGTTRFAVDISNFGPNVSPSGSVTSLTGGTLSTFQNFSPPTQFKLGFAMDPITSEGQRLTVTGELQHPNDNAENLHFGAEYQWQQWLWLRAGIKRTIDEAIFAASQSSASDYSLGIGVASSVGNTSIHFDYAFSNFNELGGVHRIDLQMGF